MARGKKRTPSDDGLRRGAGTGQGKGAGRYKTPRGRKAAGRARRREKVSGGPS
jgi:hypothetical protein